MADADARRRPRAALSAGPYSFTGPEQGTRGFDGVSCPGEIVQPASWRLTFNAGEQVLIANHDPRADGAGFYSYHGSVGTPRAEVSLFQER